MSTRRHINPPDVALRQALREDRRRMATAANREHRHEHHPDHRFEHTAPGHTTAASYPDERPARPGHAAGARPTARPAARPAARPSGRSPSVRSTSKPSLRALVHRATAPRGSGPRSAARRPTPAPTHLASPPQTVAQERTRSRRRHRGRRGGIATVRVRAIALGWLLLFGGTFARMAQLQVASPDSEIARSRQQRIRYTQIPAERGDLVDRSGVPLATTVREWRLIADPAVITKSATTDTILAKLTPILDVDGATLRPRMIDDRDGTKHYSIVARGISDEQHDRIVAIRPRLDGIYFEEEPRRVYPAGDLARGVLGRVNRAEGNGETGLEKQLQDALAGKAGERLVEKAYGRQISAADEKIIPAERGTTFVLSLDRSLQYSVEGMLATSISMTGSLGGTVLVSDVRTGDILAMANMEVKADRTVVNTEHNCALVCVYEPGSVNKAITIAAALEEGVITPETELAVPDHMQLYDHRFKDDETHPTMVWKPGQILALSSNIGTIKIARQLGKENLDRYLRGFGLGSATGIGFPGESAGLLPKLSRWNGTSIGAFPIGQGLAVTAAQMLDVYNTLANDGLRVPLRLVRGTVAADGTTDMFEPEIATRVVSAQTADTVTGMLTAVVRSGTGTRARIDGYTVAGKTGTAQKPGPDGKYRTDGYVASFAGYFPAENPALSAIVILDEPKTSIYGGEVAAPLFSEVGRFAAAHYRLSPSPGTRSLSAANETSNIGMSKEAIAAKRAGTWQQALIRRAALSAAPLDTHDPSVSVPGVPGGTAQATTTTTTTLVSPAATTAAAQALTVAESATATVPPFDGTVPVLTEPTTTTRATVPDLSARSSRKTRARAVAPALLFNDQSTKHGSSQQTTVPKSTTPTTKPADG